MFGFNFFVTYLGVFTFRSRADAALEIAGRYPISVHWDAVEGRLLCCEAQISSSALEEIKEANEKRSALSIASSSTSMPQLSVVSTV